MTPLNSIQSKARKVKKNDVPRYWTVQFGNNSPNRRHGVTLKTMKNKQPKDIIIKTSINPVPSHPHSPNDKPPFPMASDPAVASAAGGQKRPIQTVASAQRIKKAAPPILSAPELAELAACEKTMLNSQTSGTENFQKQVGAIYEITEKKLYRATHATAAALLKQKYGLARAHPYRLAKAGEILARVSPQGDSLHLLTSESHFRPLIRWLSCEPLLGPITFETLAGVHWLVAGGESGSDRRMEKAWATRLRDQCAAAQVPFYFKQWGSFDEQGVRRKRAKKDGLTPDTLEGVVPDALPGQHPKSITPCRDPAGTGRCGGRSDQP